MSLDLGSIFGSSSSTDAAAAPSTGDIVGAVTQGMAALGSLFPKGAIQDFLKNPIGTITNAITSLAGKQFTTGQYRLGERFMRHILQQDPTTYRKVPDEAVPAAQQFFTMALGVDINNDEDLQSLYSGVDAYAMRPDKEGIPPAAIQRAVNIMKYWPLYNPQNPAVWYVPWPVSVLFQIDSDPASMSYFSKLINKNLPIQMTNSAGDTNIKGVGSSSGKFAGLPWWAWLLLSVLVVLAIIFFIKHKK